MQSDDRSAIAGLFGRLADVEARAPARDPQAEAFIRQRIAAQPSAAYYMAQTLVVQEQALAQAQARIAELEASAAQRVAPPAAAPAAERSGPWGARQDPTGREDQAGRDGGFLAGAAQTALGVAGGVLMANAIGGMFGGATGAAQADAAADPVTASAEASGREEVADEGDGFFDAFGFGDFDL